MLASPHGEKFPLSDLQKRIEDGSKMLDVQGLDLGLLGYTATALSFTLKRPLVLVGSDDADARRIEQDLSFFALPQQQIVRLSEIETSPYGHLSPNRRSVMDVLATQARLTWGDRPDFLVTSGWSLARRYLSPEVILDFSAIVQQGDTIDRSTFLRTLADGGYRAVRSVEDAGTFAVRGGLIDVYPPHENWPVRIEFWDDEIESIRTFDPENQRSRGAYDGQLALPPVREELLVSPFKENARRAILEAGADAGIPTRKLQSLLEDLSNGIPFMGIEAMRPAFYTEMGTFFDYVPDNAVFLMLDPMGIADGLRGEWDGYHRAFNEHVESGHLALQPDAHALSPAEVTSALRKHTRVRAHVLQISDELGAVEGPREALEFDVPSNGALSQRLVQSRSDREPLRPLAEWARETTENGVRVVLACRQRTQLERLERLLKNFGVAVGPATAAARELLTAPTDGIGSVSLISGEVSQGFSIPSHGFVLLTEEEIFGRKAPRRRAKRTDTSNPFVSSFKELNPGDHVVHADHGIGRYEGLEKLVVGGNESDFLVIAFAGNDKLYLPVYKLGRLQKYSGGSDNPRTDKLGGTAWQKVRSKAQRSAEEDAMALLELYAQRELAEGYAFTPPDDYFRSFEGTFPFQETVDQERVIEEVLDDMVRGRPMDRLLCGDVGFGKTEVALRAAMKAVLDGKQVCVLVPTTVLALQHFRTFRDRFSDYPVRIALISRLTERGDLKEALNGLAAGRVDIAVGTHRLIGQDVEFSDLGLLILDEEHRFGVKHKERLKAMRTNVDVLAMTATPIPRTLQLSLSGIRDLSVITTPPLDRLSVRTYVCRCTDEVVRDAVMRELGRGGQVFFVHNRVQSIEARVAWLTSLVPEARIAVGHGQMEPRQLERVMVDFTEGRFNVLVATTIIESGIDIPTANTILVDNADRLGLAQLYQLRGRVGRSRERGYCYLLVPSQSVLQREARARLSVIQKFTDLGSGFHVASHDLELRGAGELLGAKQKGHVQAVGIDLYAQLLEDAVRQLRGEQAKVNFDPEINLPINARIPEGYVPDNQLRLMFYKRLANGTDEERVLEIFDEMQDRFGPAPGPVENLVDAMRIRTLARHIGLRAVDGGPTQVTLTFHPESPMPIEQIITLVSDPKSQFTAPADFKLVYRFRDEERRNTLTAVRICLQRLGEFVTDLG